jgi:hypothetical protein
LLKIVDTGAWDHLTVMWRREGDVVGNWAVAGERATFHFDHDGVARGDVTLEAGRACTRTNVHPSISHVEAPCRACRPTGLFCTCGAWGDVLQRRGTLTIKQSRFGWMPFLPAPREASFIVGTFTAKVVAEESAADETTP